MKKQLLMIVATVLTMATGFTFQSCTEDETFDPQPMPEQPKYPTTLRNSYWAYEEKFSYGDYVRIRFYYSGLDFEYGYYYKYSSYSSYLEEEDIFSTSSSIDYSYNANEGVLAFSTYEDGEVVNYQGEFQNLQTLKLYRVRNGIRASVATLKCSSDY